MRSKSGDNNGRRKGASVAGAKGGIEAGDGVGIGVGAGEKGFDSVLTWSGQALVCPKFLSLVMRIFVYRSPGPQVP